jgi:hypothetical protein
MIKSQTRKHCRGLLSVFFLFCLAVLCGCGTGQDPSGGSGTTTVTAASISLSASSATVQSDGSTTTTITVNALNSANAALTGVVVTMSADTGVLGAGSVTTSATNPATVTFYSPGNKINRTATITATSGTVSAQIPIQIVGSTVTLESSLTSLPNNGVTEAILTVTAKDAGSNVVPNAAVALTQAGGGSVTITPASGPTNNSGVFTAHIKGASVGSVKVTAAALGATAFKDIEITPVGANFAIDQQTLNGTQIAFNMNPIAMKMGDTLNLRVNAPGATTVTFATTIGIWDGTAKSVIKNVVAGKATATLTTAQAGVANVQIFDNNNNQDTRTVAMSSGAAAYRIVLQASPTNVPVSVGTTTGSATLTATVYDNALNPIGGAPVAFSIVNPTSGGETVSPAAVSTALIPNGDLGVGQARASFTSGSISSTGITIRASVVGTTVSTNTAPSGNDATIIIGGVAGSIAFGQATVINELNDATYSLPMSVLVADSAGAAVANADVSLSVWPIAWSTGTACAVDADNGGTLGTFWGEDRNENLFLDTNPAPPEDGARYYYADKTKTTLYAGTQDGVLTPVNSASGTVPSKVTTDENGVATFNLNYPKQSAIWTIVRLRATTKVAGTETRAEQIFRLAASQGDVQPCKLSSPYKF